MVLLKNFYLFACTFLGRGPDRDPLVVDLGTSRHRAIIHPDEAIYTFKNVPYAEAPLGDLRFKAPVARTSVNRTIDDGSNSRICFQAAGNYSKYTLPLVQEYAANCGGLSDVRLGNSDNLTQSEDCLLLDVYTPKEVWENRFTTKRPVLVWIHGGGYTKWSKEAVNPAGIAARSMSQGMGGMIVVAINYRLGLFGFPPGRRIADDVESNAGLYDQRLAFDWVREHIRRFGGDGDQVTAIGESAGGGSILAQLVAFGGKDGSAPFDRAIIQSPAMMPIIHKDQYDRIHQDFLKISGTSGFDEARNLNSTELQAINTAMLANGAFTDTVFQLNVDGKFLRDVPARLLTKGKVDRSVDIVLAHNSREGLLFTDPRVENDAGFRAYFSNLLPNLPRGKIDTLAQEIYPLDFSGTLPYKNHTERLMLAIGDALFNCHAFGANLAYGNQTRGYLFDVCPGVHAQDVSYSLYNDATVDSFGLPIDLTAVGAIQDWIIGFTTRGSRGRSKAKELPIYGPNARILRVHRQGTDASEFSIGKDPAANLRCRFWLDAILEEEGGGA